MKMFILVSYALVSFRKKTTVGKRGAVTKYLEDAEKGQDQIVYQQNERRRGVL